MTDPILDGVYCLNCRAQIARGAEVCPHCGAVAGTLTSRTRAIAAGQERRKEAWRRHSKLSAFVWVALACVLIPALWIAGQVAIRGSNGSAPGEASEGARDSVRLLDGGTRPRIARGMTPHEVEAIMGAPSHVYDSPDLSGRVWNIRTYPDGDGRLIVRFGPDGVVWYTETVTPESDRQMADAIRRATEDQKRLMHGSMNPQDMRKMGGL